MTSPRLGASVARRALLLILLACCALPATATDTITLGRSSGTMGTIAAAVLREAYQRLGIALATKQYPAERALLEANRGELDGELGRIAGLEGRYPNLIRVPVAINQIEGMAYTNKVSFPVTGWESLRPYQIGVRIGIKFAEDGTRGMNVQPVSSNELLFTKLELGRTDVVVSTRTEGMFMIKSLKTRNVKVLEPPLVTIKLYHYLHRKNRALVPDITRVLQAMEKEGRIRAIQQEMLAKVMANAEAGMPAGQ